MIVDCGCRFPTIASELRRSESRVPYLRAKSDPFTFGSFNRQLTVLNPVLALLNERPSLTPYVIASVVVQRNLDGQKQGFWHQVQL